jgi:L-ascorbate metabolism protein UlaG (beta-lactamase superfamily)
MSTRVRWLGHSAISIETGGQTVLIDPFLTGNPACPIAPDSLDPQYIVVSHGHADHVGDTVSLAKRSGAVVVSNFECSEWFKKQGVRNLHGLGTGGSVVFPFGRLKLTHAVHSSSLPDGSYGGTACGIHLFLNDGLRIYDAADTALFGDMQLIGKEGVDLAIVPIGDYYTMGPADSLRAIELLQPRNVLPIHYNTFPLLEQDRDAWAASVRKHTSAEPVLLKPGDAFEV